MKILTRVFVLFLFYSCNNNQQTKEPPQAEAKADSTNSTDFTKGSFGYDLNFLKKYHNDLVVLGNDSTGSQIIILPAYQGRVMTSTATGSKGTSFGWLNYDLIASNRAAQHINAVGGEERFWLGPEGGQFSIFFKKGKNFVFDNWFVPKELDTEPFQLASANNNEAKFEKKMQLENYSGNKFNVLVNRSIRLLSKRNVDSIVGMTIPVDVQTVAFESDNKITNEGTQKWHKKSGMLSIWILSMLNATEKTTVAVPYRSGDSTNLGKIVTTDYFGTIPPERLKNEGNILLFKADANYRSKIGIAPRRALPIAGSYDAVNNVLTIAQFSLPPGANEYVNSLWKMQDNPFGGDAVNSYNDGPVEAKQLGKFYELESSSPAASLAPGKSMQHWHRTIHFKGNKQSLDSISKKLLGIGIEKIVL